MHILILSKRNAEAQARLLRSAEALARHFDLDPALIEGLKDKTKDLPVRAMKEREGVAALLEALALQVGALKGSASDEETVTAVTEPEGTEPTGEAEPVEDLSLVGENLPPPVLEEEEPTEEPTLEEEPAPKATKKGRGKSSKRK